MIKMKIGFSTLSCPDWAWSDIYSLAKDFKFDGIEIRGLGILDVKELYGVSSVKPQEAIDFVINLELWDEKKTYDRLGMDDETTDILGIKVPSVTIPVGPGRNLAIIVEAAAINYRVKKMGYNAAQDLVSRVFPGKNPDV